MVKLSIMLKHGKAEPALDASEVLRLSAECLGSAREIPRPHSVLVSQIAFDFAQARLSLRLKNGSARDDAIEEHEDVIRI